MRRTYRRKRKPAFMNSSEFNAAMNELAAFHQRGGTRAKQGRSPLRRLMQPFDEELTDYVHNQFDGLCAYTEVAADGPDDPLQIEWHRPVSNATNQVGDVAHEHYWWLALDWRNWYLASKHLAAVKANSFPVRGERMAAPEPTEPPQMPVRRGRLDTGILLDPCQDSPAFWLRFSENGRVVARRNLVGADRGAETIDLLDLDNDALRASRSAAIRRALVTVETAEPRQLPRFLSDISTTTSPHRTAVAQALIRRRLTDSDVVSTADLRQILTSHPDEFLNEFVESNHDRRDYPRPAQKLLRDLTEHTLANNLPHALAPAFADLSPKVESGSNTNRTVSPAPDPEPVAPLQPVAGRRINPKTTISLTNRLNRVEIKNFRAIVHLVLDLSAEQVELVDVVDLDPEQRQQIVSLPGRPWKMFLGENGSGKSSVLHAIALALCGAGIENAMQTADLTWDQLLRWQGPDEAERHDGQIRLDFSGGKRIDLRFDDADHRFHGLGADAPAIHLNVRGYGAARFPATKNTATTAAALTADALHDQSPTSCKIDNLLDSTVPILNTNDWLGKLEDPEFNVAAETISDLLGESSLVLLNPSEHEPRDTTSGQRITREDPVPPDPTNSAATTPPRKVLVDGEPLNLVSDGYRSVIALGCEIMAGVGGLATATGGTSDMREAEGIVLLDEIGAHLHPRWRMQITGKLRTSFPNVQFFVTTHEPLCLRGLVENEVVRVSKYEKHGVLLEEIDRAPGRYRVDQLLTSEFFGLNSAIDPRVDRLFTEYYGLKRQRRPSSAELERMESLEEQINDRALRPVLGYTRRDQLIFEAIDDFLIGDALHVSLPQQRQERRAEVITKVANIWKRFGDGPTP